MSPIKWLFAVLALIACGLWMFPKVITGDYAEITIGKITYNSSGQASLSYSSITSSETPIINAFYDGNRYTGGGSGIGSGIFGRPVVGSAGIMFMLNPEKMHRLAEVPESVWSKRLLVKENQTIRLHRGERLYFYDFLTSDGVRHDGYVEVVSTKRVAQN